jgi:hypothetical protein
MEAAPTSLKPRHGCNVCFKTFARPEHLTRHTSVHVETPQHICVTCKKNFRRSDALHRHELIHQQSQTSPVKGVRACLQCVKAKTKCDGCVPCTRCLKRATQCESASTSQQGQSIAEALIFQTDSGTLPATDLPRSSEVSNQVPNDMQKQQQSAAARGPMAVHDGESGQSTSPTSILTRHGTEANSAAAVRHTQGQSQVSVAPPAQAVQDMNSMPDQFRTDIDGTASLIST